MTKEQLILWAGELVMFAAWACFLKGFAVRRTDLALHKRLGKLGALLVVAGLVVVEFCMRGLGWEFPIRSRTILHVHIAVASVALLLLALLVITGLRGPRRLHVKLWIGFLPLYSATVLLSLGAFDLF